MKALKISGLVLMIGVGLFLLWFGYIYANVKDFLWFHAAAVQPDALEAMKNLYFALMRLIGGFSVAVSILGLYLTFGLVRRGSLPATAAVCVAYLTVFGVAGYTAEKLAADTGAPTSWTIMGVLSAATVVGAGLSHIKTELK